MSFTEAKAFLVRPERGTGALLAPVPSVSLSDMLAAKPPFGSMKPDHVPAGGLPYWVALCLASILGCNTGDLFASFFGFVSGLPFLIAVFAGLLFLERRDDRPTQAYYWLAIIVVRTAATNLADFAGHQLGITATLGLLSVLLGAALFARRYRGDALSARQTGEVFP